MSKYSRIATLALWMAPALLLLPPIIIGGSALSDTVLDWLDATPKATEVIPLPPVNHIRMVLKVDGIENNWAQIENTINKCISAAPSLPALLILGGNKEKLDNIARQAKNGDMFFLYCSPPDHWQGLAGRAGLILVRDWQGIANLTITMN